MQAKINMLKQKLKKHKEIIYQEVLDNYSNNKYEQAEIIPYIWYLVLTGYLSINLYEKITPSTLLKVSHE